MRNFSWKKTSHTLEGSTAYTDYFETIVHNYNKISTLIPNNFVNVGISNSTIPPFFLFWIWDFILFLVLLRLFLSWVF